MDPNKNYPYFPPPPGQTGVPPPLPPRIVSPEAAQYPPQPNAQTPYPPAQHYQPPQNVGGYVPAAGGFNVQPMPSHAAPPPLSYPANPQGYPTGSWLQQPQQPQHVATTPSAQQPYGSPSTHAYQTPSPVPSSTRPPMKSQLQTIQPYLNTQKLLGSYQDLKSKARTKLSQYLVQPPQQPSQPNAHVKPHAQYQNVNPSSVPPTQPGTASSQPQYHYPQAAQYHQVIHTGTPPGAVQTPPPHSYNASVPVQPQNHHHPSTPTVPTTVPQRQSIIQQPHHPTLPAGQPSPAFSSPAVSPPISSFQHHPSVSPATPIPNIPGAILPQLPPVPAVNEQPILQQVPQAQSVQQAHATDIYEAPSDARYSIHEPYHSQPPSHLNTPTNQTTATTVIPAEETQSGAPSNHVQQNYYPPPPPVPQMTPPVGSHATGPQEPITGYTPPIPSISKPVGPPGPADTPVSKPETPYHPVQDVRSGHVAAPQQQIPAPAIDQISSQLSRVSLKPTLLPDPTPLGPEDEDFHEWKRPIPTVVEDGKPNDVIWECPDQRVIDYECEWYHIPEIPDFIVCTRCHEMYLSGTPSSSSFTRVKRPEGRCRFNVPRITRALLPEYLKTKDFQPIKDFMSKRLEVPDCHGQAGVKGTAGIKWFIPLEKSLSDMGMISCEACYEDIILGTSLRQHWGPHDKIQAADASWACDICIPFLGRTILKYSKLPGHTWEGWVEAAAKHVKLPQCEKTKAVSPSSRRWVHLCGKKVPEMKICEKCYEETLAYTPLGLEFELIDVEPSATGLDWMDVALGYRTQAPDPWVCSASSFPVYVAIAAAKSQKDINVLVKAAEVIVSSPSCTEQGIVDGTWYTLAGGGCDDLMLCAACYAAYVNTWKLDRFYQRVTGLDSSQAYLCSFQRSAPRWFQQLYRMQEGIETGVWSRYSAWVRKFSGIPTCPKIDQVGNRKWYGWDDCTICPECWVTFCKDSSPAPGVKMEFDNQLVAETRMCCMYSPRMRGKWVEACKTGSADELVEFSRVRHGVYVQTVLQIRMLRQMQEMQMMNAMHAGMMSITYQGIESIKLINGTGDGYMHGNSTLGWHETAEGATSAAFRNQMSAGMSQSNSASTWMMIAQLTEQWSQVE
ncbi:uncharacterized protein CTRU02_200216 [Colletotrichum truncatum]|uniref:Integral membrane protein n=1 Tax=Colletotrichum truncatum TaxID=5467 RepID=A0ACC3ZE86_COLTU|nr:uncharacterized protein CTRU02_05095 [Colletotrichum truncatum]KAF6794894.1 integral membrane protein [Colletotrichum truncatum]